MHPDASRWLAIPRPNAWAELRLICFPYAGGTTATYLPWQSSLPQQVELVAVQPPGRGNRLAEQGYHCPDALVDDLYPILKPYLDQPYAFFGHSMGGRIAFALMRRIQREGGRLPVRFIASGSPAPDIAPKEDLDQSSDQAFISYLKKLGGTPQEVLESRELMAFYLPRLRADFSLAAVPTAYKGAPMETTLSLFAGRDDSQVPMDDIIGWRSFFRFGGELTEFDGGHMFIESDRQVVLSCLNRALQESLMMLACDGFNSG